MTRILFLFTLAIFSSVLVVQGRFMKGKMKSGKSWNFLTRFVFQPTGAGVNSSFKYSFRFHRKTRLVMLAYFDQVQTTCTKYTACPSWEDIFYRDDPCQFKDWAARKHGNAFDLWTTYDYIQREGSDVYHNVSLWKNRLDDYEYRQASGHISFASSRNRWFYFALANCKSGTKDGPKIDPNKVSNSDDNAPSPSAEEEKVYYDETGIVMCDEDEFCQGPMDVEYSLTMKNSEGNKYTDHLSADEFGILEATIAFFLLYLLIFAWATYTVVTLIKRKQLHHTVKIFYFSIVCEIIAYIIRLFYWENMTLGYDPIHSPDMRGGKRAYVVFELLSNFAMMLVILLLAKGWTIVRRKISAMGRVKISVYFSFYVFIAVTAFGYAEFYETAGVVVYKLASTPGILYVLSRIFAAAWFSYAVFTTYKNYASKRQFYKFFYAVYLVWILSVPLEAVLANGVVPIWHREKFVVISEYVFTMFAHIMLLLLLIPSRYNKQFPFHAKTTHMDGKGLPPGTPSRKGSSVLFNKTGTQGSFGRQRASLSGNMGAIFDNAIDRAKELANTMRYKLMQIQDYSDDLVETLHSYESVGDEVGEDLAQNLDENSDLGHIAPPPGNARNNARSTLEREFEMATQNNDNV